MEPNRAGPLISVHEPWFLNGKHANKKTKNDSMVLNQIRAINDLLAVPNPKTRPQTVSGKSQKPCHKFGQKISELDSPLIEPPRKKKTKIASMVLNQIREINDLLVVPKLQTDRKKSLWALRKACHKFGHRPARFEVQIAWNGCRNWGEPVSSPGPTYCIRKVSGSENPWSHLFLFFSPICTYLMVLQI